MRRVIKKLRNNDLVEAIATIFYVILGVIGYMIGMAFIIIVLAGICCAICAPILLIVYMITH